MSTERGVLMRNTKWGDQTEIPSAAAKLPTLP